MILRRRRAASWTSGEATWSRWQIDLRSIGGPERLDRGKDFFRLSTSLPTEPLHKIHDASSLPASKDPTSICPNIMQFPLQHVDNTRATTTTTKQKENTSTYNNNFLHTSKQKKKKQYVRPHTWIIIINWQTQHNWWAQKKEHQHWPWEWIVSITNGNGIHLTKSMHRRRRLSFVRRSQIFREDFSFEGKSGSIDDFSHKLSYYPPNYTNSTR